MTRGATPAVAAQRMRAIGSRPWRLAAVSAATTSAASSLTPYALPAVTVPFLRNCVGSSVNASMVVARGRLSWPMTVASLFLCGILTSTISRPTHPLRCVSAALFGEAVLILAADAELRRDVLVRIRHRIDAAPFAHLGVTKRRLIVVSWIFG